MHNPWTFREEGDVVIVDVRGRLTIWHEATALRAMLQELTEAGYRNVLLNMAGVTHLDSAGVGALIAGYTSIAQFDGALKVVNLQTRVNCVLCAARLDSVFEKYGGERDAFMSFYGKVTSA